MDIDNPASTSTAQRTLEPLKKHYSISYVKSQMLFENTFDYKLFHYIFHLYVRNYRYGVQNPEYVELKIKKTLHETAFADKTYRRSLDRLEKVGLIDKNTKHQSKDNGLVVKLNAGYYLGVISILNQTEDKTTELSIKEAFETGDKNTLQKFGYKYISNPNIPTTSASTIAVLNADGQKDHICNNKIVTETTSNCHNDNKNEIFVKLTTIEPHNIKDYIQVINLDKNSAFWVLKSDEKIVNATIGVVNATKSIVRETTSDGQKDHSIYIIRDNEYFKKTVTENSILKNENEDLKQQIKVLLEKNQNNEQEPHGSSSLKEEIVSEKEEDEKKSIRCRDKYGDAVELTPEEARQIELDKINDPMVQNFIKEIRNQFPDGVQLNYQEYQKALTTALKNNFTLELESSNGDKIVEQSVEDFDDDLEGDQINQEDRQKILRMKEMIELKRFCKNDFKKVFPYFINEGGAYFVHYTEQPKLSYEERLQEFYRISKNNPHDYSDDQQKLPDFEKRNLIVEAFNNNFPEGQSFNKNEMIEFVQFQMVDIQMFSYKGFEYDAYGILAAFEPQIRINYDLDSETGERLKMETMEEARIRLQGESSEESEKSKKRAITTLKSDSLDYDELLRLFRQPKITLTPEKYIPSNPVLIKAFQHLGFKNGQVIEEWEYEAILNVLIKRYGGSGYGTAGFVEPYVYAEMLYKNHKVKIQNLPDGENVTEKSKEVDEDKPEEYIPRQRIRRGRS